MWLVSNFHSFPLHAHKKHDSNYILNFCLVFSSFLPCLHYQIYFFFHMYNASCSALQFNYIAYSTYWITPYEQCVVLLTANQEIAQVIFRVVSSDSVSWQSLIKLKLIFSYSCKKSEPSNSVNLSWSIHSRIGQHCTKLSGLAD